MFERIGYVFSAKDPVSMAIISSNVSSPWMPKMVSTPWLIRSMNLGGGYYLWTACLRYFFTLPLMALLLVPGNGFAAVFASIRRKPVRWLVWSTVGFGLFYAPLSAAAAYRENWFISALWQFTIVAGVLLTPLFGKAIPVKNLLLSLLIVAGILLMQLSKLRAGVQADWPMLLLTMGVAAFSYPLGNRKMMQTVSGEGLSTPQQVFGMTLCSMPFWLLCAAMSYAQAGLPSYVGAGHVPPAKGSLTSMFLVWQRTTGRCGFWRVGPHLSVSENGERQMQAARGLQPHERLGLAGWRA